MKFICEKERLDFAINVVNKAISPNNTLPVLNNILIEAQNGKIRFASTNLEIAITCEIDARVEKEGAITVPAKLVTGYLAFLSEKEVELVVEGKVLAMKTASSSTKINCINAEEFPLIPEVKDGKSFKVPVKAFHDAVLAVTFASSLSSSRPVLSGVLFAAAENGVKMVGTDSYRLAEKKLAVSADVEGLNCVVPARTLSELAKIISKIAVEEMAVEVTKNQILFSVGDISLVSRLIDGKYPDYEKIIPVESKSEITVGVEALSMVLKRVSLFAKENNNSVKLSCGDGRLVISSEETKVGEEVAELAVELNGEENEISLNAQYLLDVLMFIGQEKIRLVLNDKASPAAIRPLSADDYVYIIMPLKI